MARLLRRVAGVCAFVATNFSIHKKLLELMDEITDEKQKEYEILHEIESVEKHHEEMKRQNLLRHADPDLNIKQSTFLLKADEEEEPKRANLLNFFAFLLLLMPRQNPTPKPESN